MTPLEQSFSF